MIKAVVLLAVLVVSAGCGSNESQTKFQGVTEKTDYIVQGQRFLAQNDFPMAIKSFNQAIKEDPKNPDNYFALGQVYLGLKNFEGAVDNLTVAAKLNPYNGDAFYFLALSNGFSGNKEEAIKAAQRSADIYYANKEDDKFKRSLALVKGLVDSEQEEVAATP